MTILGCFGGTTILGSTHIYPMDLDEFFRRSLLAKSSTGPATVIFVHLLYMLHRLKPARGGKSR